MDRRNFVQVGLAALAMPGFARAAEARVLRFVPQADLAVLDPVWTTAYQTRDHAFLVFDTLFGQDAGYAAFTRTADAGKRLRRGGRGGAAGRLDRMAGPVRRSGATGGRLRPAGEARQAPVPLSARTRNAA